MEFGPEIKVDGVRPEWLKDGDVWQWRIALDPHFEDGISPSEYEKARTFGLIEAIRLPANDPRYAPTPDERAVAPELVARLVAVVKSVGDIRHGHDTNPGAWFGIPTDLGDEARAIVAALEPVDPMLLEARQVVAGLYEGQGVAHLREQALSGEGDEWFHTKVARAALARGRQLEKEGK